MKRCIVASSRSWFTLQPELLDLEGVEFVMMDKNENLNSRSIARIGPEVIFFPHWNYIVPESICQNYRCIVFHTAPLPYGRGGSPIQHLIINGFESSLVCAIEMTKELDCGPIYCTEEVSLLGTIDEIFNRVNFAANNLMCRILTCDFKAIPQKGEIVRFNRLKREDNEISANLSEKEIYDRVRMVDGKDYQPAFIKHGRTLIEFSNARHKDDELTATVK